MAVTLLPIAGVGNELLPVFRRFHALLVSRVEVDGDLQGTKMLLDERLDLIPFQPADTGGEAGQGEAGDFLGLDNLVQLAQAND